MSSTRDRPSITGARRRWVLASVGAALVVLVVVLVLVLTGDGDGDGQASAAPAATSSAGPGPDASPGQSPTSAPSSSPSGPAASTPAAAPTEPAGPGPVTGIPAMLAPVALDEAAVAADGVTVTLPAIAAIDAVGSGPGNVSGPALAITVRVANATAEPISLDGLQVNVAYSEQETAASPVNDPAAAPAQGVLAAGAAAEGRYVFTVPAGERDLVTVTVGYTAAAPLLVFQGPVG
ncbi:hypothetical protein [Modestobacter sp. VKM Ac-2984]|uniref:hypothetical protein n=1 Tax=Modestobacter sp. VKM Ac-2984 TaxID=3004138 RepID=UPI0022AB27CA|nr:hypothetical protein [Modestobacter sp. VKM Ac-2984]MCZ2817748.1 hypothetical protein [Modestobacter sp. VKM Ac-2984]